MKNGKDQPKAKHLDLDFLMIHLFTFVYTHLHLITLIYPIFTAD